MKYGNKRNPYMDALKCIERNYGTSGQEALAKCVLSIYNPRHAFSAGEILGPLDEKNSRLALRKFRDYATHGETTELLEAGRWVYGRFAHLIELSEAMSQARYEVRRKWEQLQL